MRLMFLVISLAVVVGSLAGGRLDRLPHADAGIFWFVVGAMGAGRRRRRPLQPTQRR
jgi:hypothetical protein